MFFSQVTQNKVIILQNTPPPPLAATNDSRYLQSIAADAWKTHIWRSRFEHFLGEAPQCPHALRAFGGRQGRDTLSFPKFVDPPLVLPNDMP